MSRKLPESVKTFVGLICTRCGGISDGPIAEGIGVCACTDDSEVHYEATPLLRVSDLPAIEKALLKEVRDDVDRQLTGAVIRREETVGKEARAITVTRTSVLGEIIRMLNSYIWRDDKA